MVRLEGLEPPRLAPPEPKSGVSTNFTTAATKLQNSFINYGEILQSYNLLIFINLIKLLILY